MLQQSATSKLVKPKRFDVFLHAGKTLRLVGSLLRDPRIPVISKMLFIGSIAGLLVLLLFPDVLSEAVLSTVLPLVGTVAGVPIDAGFDWVAFALLIVNLMRFFPADIVAEHYGAIFHK